MKIIMDMTNGSTDVASLRHCVCDQGLLNRTDGSARLMQGISYSIRRKYNQSLIFLVFNIALYR